jgi:hypothetical protein
MPTLHAILVALNEVIDRAAAARDARSAHDVASEVQDDLVEAVDGMEDVAGQLRDLERELAQPALTQSAKLAHFLHELVASGRALLTNPALIHTNADQSRDLTIAVPHFELYLQALEQTLQVLRALTPPPEPQQVVAQLVADAYATSAILIRQGEGHERRLGDDLAAAAQLLHRAYDSWVVAWNPTVPVVNRLDPGQPHHETPEGP